MASSSSNSSPRLNSQRPNSTDSTIPFNVGPILASIKYLFSEDDSNQNGTGQTNNFDDLSAMMASLAEVEQVEDANNPQHSTGVANTAYQYPLQSYMSMNSPNIWAWEYQGSNNGGNQDYLWSTYQVPYLNTGRRYSSLRLQDHHRTSSLNFSRKDYQYLQDALDCGCPEDTSRIYVLVHANVFEIITNEYGRHVFNKLIGMCGMPRVQQIIKKLTLQSELLISASLTRYGSQSIQRLIKLLKRSPLVQPLTAVLGQHIYILMTHPEGKHVIESCFTDLDSQNHEPLSEALVQHCLELATHERACITLNNCISSIRGPHRDNLLSVISESSLFLSQDPSGNFVLQNVLDLKNPIWTDKICSHLQGAYARLSTQKCGTYVIETCLRSTGMRYGIEELMASDQLHKVARNVYGNYVIQTALQVTKIANKEWHQSLLLALRPHMPSLEFHPYGKNVYKLIRDGVPLVNKRHARRTVGLL